MRLKSPIALWSVFTGILLGAVYLAVSPPAHPPPTAQHEVVRRYVLMPAVLESLAPCHLQAVSSSRDRVSLFLSHPKAMRLELIPRAHAKEWLVANESTAFRALWEPPAPECIEKAARQLQATLPDDFWPMMRDEHAPPPRGELPPLPSGLLVVAEPRTIPFAAPAYLLNRFSNETFRRVLWWLFAAIGWALWLLPPLVAPFVIRIPSWSGLATRRAVWMQVLRWSGFVVLTYLILRGVTVPDRMLYVEHAGFLDTAAFCARDQECPIVGQTMGALAVRLGPLFYQLLTPLLLWGFTFEHVLEVVLVAGTLAAVSMGVLLSRVFGGLSWLPAMAVFGVCGGTAASTIATPQHAAFLPLSLAAIAWGLSGWASGQGGWSLVILSAGLCSGTQLHGTVGALVLGVMPVLWVLRRPTPTWSIILSGSIWVVAYLPWFVFYASTRFADFGSVAWPSSRSEDLWGNILGVLAVASPQLLVLGLLAAWRVWRTEAEGVRRDLARAWLWMFTFVASILVLTMSRWHSYYFLIFLPSVAWLVALGVSQRKQVIPKTWLRRAVLGSAWAWIALLLGSSLAVDLLQQVVKQGEPTETFRWSEVREIAEIVRRVVPPEAEGLRVHGALWERVAVPRSHLANTHLGDPRPAVSNRHLLVAEDCERLPEAFAIEQHPITTGISPHVVGIYESRLSGWTATLSAGADELWSRVLSLPVEDYELQLGNFMPLERAHPEVIGAPQLLNSSGKPLEGRIALPELWATHAEAPLRLQGTYVHGSDRRVLAVKVQSGTRVELRVDGARLDPLATTTHESFGTTIEWFEPPPQPPGTNVVIDWRVSFTQGAFGTLFPLNLEMFESPWPTCAVRRAAR